MRLLGEIFWTVVIVCVAMAFYALFCFVVGFAMLLSYAGAIGFGVVVGMAEARLSAWVRRR